MENTTVKNKQTPIFTALTEHTISIIANKIYHVLSSDNVSQDTKSALSGILFAAANEAGMGFDDTPEIAKVAFPYLIRKLDTDYGRAVVHSIDHMIDASAPESVADELKQYEIRFDSKTASPSA